MLAESLDFCTEVGDENKPHNNCNLVPATLLESYGEKEFRSIREEIDDEESTSKKIDNRTLDEFIIDESHRMSPSIVKTLILRKTQDSTIKKIDASGYIASGLNRPSVKPFLINEQDKKKKKFCLDLKIMGENSKSMLDLIQEQEEISKSRDIIRRSPRSMYLE